MFRHILATLFFAAACAVAWMLPDVRWYLLAGYTVYFLCLLRWPHAWQYAVPALIPLLDLAPYTGEIYLDEIDGVMLVTFAGFFARQWQEAVTHRYAPLTLMAMLLLFLSYSISLVIGFTGAENSHPGIITSHLIDPWNAIRVFKGFAWSLLLLPFLRFDADNSRRRLLLGFGIAMCGISLVALYERYVFAGPLNFGSIYRVTSSFSSINTGDGPIDVWLAMTAPALFVLAFGPFTKVKRWLALPAALLLAYALIGTGSRAPLVAVFIGAVLFVIVTAISRFGTAQKKNLPAIFGGLLLLALIGLIGPQMMRGSFLSDRFGTLDKDLATREQHWKNSIALVDDSIMARGFGIGLGRYADLYIEKAMNGAAARYEFVKDKGQTFLRLTPKPGPDQAENIFWMQSLKIDPRASYLISFNARSAGSAGRLTIGFCERWLLSHANHPGGCALTGFEIQKSREWIPYSKNIAAQGVGSSNGWRLLRLKQVTGLPFDDIDRRPVKLMIWTTGALEGVEIDNISVVTESGRELVQNGTFSSGHERWFWTTQDHLAYHAKNLFVHLYVEQGWLGVFGMSLLILIAAFSALRQCRRDPIVFPALLASLVGLLLTAISVSITDQPRNSMLVYLILMLCCLMPKRAKINLRSPDLV